MGTVVTYTFEHCIHASRFAHSVKPFDKVYDQRVEYPPFIVRVDDSDESELSAIYHGGTLTYTVSE